MPEQGLNELLDSTLTRWSVDPCNLLQMLIDIQHAFGQVPAEAVDRLSQRLDISRTHINGVIGFYTFLSAIPCGQYDIRFSNNIVDLNAGSRERAEQLMQRLGVREGVTDTTLGVNVSFTSCIGMCDQAPAALVNGRLLGALSEADIDSIATLIEQGVAPADWPAALFEIRPNLLQRGALLESDLPAGAALRAFDEAGADTMLDRIEQAGLRGRGGAGFPTAQKWRLCAATDAGQRVVVCNADEGEPGTFKDRLLLQQYAGRVIEGMTLCAAVIGADTGFIYLRGEYAFLREPLEALLAQRRCDNLLGQGIGGRVGFDFDIRVHLGAGAYICGEESALIESLEGKRGVPRIRPPFPVNSGYRGLPTVVNNVETFVAAAAIAVHGADWFRQHGTGQSPGTKLLSISGDCARPGIYEVEFGTPFNDILDRCGAADVQALQVGGPSGSLLAPADFARRLDYEDVATGGSLMVFGAQRDLLEVVANFIAFFRHESCGFCTPCRVGTTLIDQLLAKMAAGHGSAVDNAQIERLARTMRETSHCGLGATAANPVKDLLQRFPEMVAAKTGRHGFEPAFDLENALADARGIIASSHGATAEANSQ